MSSSDDTHAASLAAVTRAIVEGGVVPIVLGSSHSLKGEKYKQPIPPDLDATRDILISADRLARLHAPGSPPPLVLSAAIWAAQVAQFACQRLVDKVEIDTELPIELVESEPAGITPTDHWSVDLVFRIWWDLVQRSFASNAQDTLNGTLLEIAARWPLAAVGTPACSADDRLEIVWHERCLKRIYVDRVIARRDETKAKHPAVADFIAHISGQNVPAPLVQPTANLQ